MNLYNYTYEDLFKDIDLTLDPNVEEKFVSKVYPIDIEVFSDKLTNRPYLKYTGLVRSNKQLYKITFPKLEATLDQLRIDSEASVDVLRYAVMAESTQRKFGEDEILFTLSKPAKEEIVELARKLNMNVNFVTGVIDSGRCNNEKMC